MILSKPFLGDYKISMEFGAKPDWYVKVTGYPHNGIDYAMPVGVQILATDDGQVIYADSNADRDGCGVNIAHGWGMSQYWHLSRVVVNYGDRVKRGQPIGYSGATGWATGPHLHFGIKVKGAGAPGMRGWTNPALYLADGLPEVEMPPVIKRRHLVLWGDTLWGLAVKYYGAGHKWPKIYNANKDKIKNPNVIRVGWILKIPM